MIVIKVIAGIIVYVIISIITTILFIYADRKAGETAQEVYDDEFYEYCVAGFLFPISIPLLVIAGICKFIKIMCVAIVETKIAIDEDKE
jgi:TRAP-type mannitol/chloroaromatic compound transport system permease small subunit